MPYAEYLHTPEWRTRRNTALRAAQWACARCRGRRELQVHHRSYQHLGAELDHELEVLCRGCHLGHHVVQAQDRIGVYVKLVSDVLDSGAFTTIADIADAVKSRCAALRMGYHDGQVSAAMRLVDRRLPVNVPRRVMRLLERAEPGGPVPQSEAAGILSRLNAACAIKHMPSVKATPDQQADHEARIREQIAEVYRWRRRRRPLAETLAEIFTGEA